VFNQLLEGQTLSNDAQDYACGNIQVNHLSKLYRSGRRL